MSYTVIPIAMQVLLHIALLACSSDADMRLRPKQKLFFHILVRLINQAQLTIEIALILREKAL